MQMLHDLNKTQGKLQGITQ